MQHKEHEIEMEIEIEMTPLCTYHPQDFARHKPYVLIMICCIHKDPTLLVSIPNV